MSSVKHKTAFLTSFIVMTVFGLTLDMFNVHIL